MQPSWKNFPDLWLPELLFEALDGLDLMDGEHLAIESLIQRI
jgi:hypothetical protein